MNKINKKQKILLGIIVAILLIALIYYIYTKDEEIITYDSGIQEEQREYIEKNETKEETRDNDSNIIVHISGSVNMEGIVELKINSRLVDAIEKAGGLKEDANISKINLAYILEDGMKIYVPSINDKEEASDSVTSIDETSKYITNDSGTISNDNYKENNIKSININTATQTEFETLPGIGPSIALKIINYRNENGKFRNIEDIKNVSGIGENKFNNIKNMICVK